MEPNLFVRFRGIDLSGGTEVNLAALGESLVGFDSVLREFAQIVRIDGDLEIKAVANREGSFIVEIVAWLNAAVPSLPFYSVDDYLNFLRLAGDPALQQATQFFQSIEGAHRSLNDWASSRPVDFALLSALFAKVVHSLWKKARKNKTQPDYNDKELPRRVAEELHKLINKRRFGRVLKPIIEDEMDSIEVSTNRDFSNAVKVDQRNFQDYLAEDEQILPHLENGKIYKLFGTITSLKGTRGDSLTFQLTEGGESYNLDAYPADGQNSKAYREFYQERVLIEAQVSRKSFYKKPKLHLYGVSLVQGELKFPIDPTQPNWEQP